MIRNTEVLIIGAGVAGLYFALNLNKHIKVIIVNKGNLKKCNSYLAQGGIATRRDLNDRDNYIKDTLRAGKYKNDLKAVEILVDESMKNIEKLNSIGVPFDKENNTFSYTREAAHSNFRIVHCKDKTGKKVVETLINEIRKRKNIEVIENVNIVDLNCFNNLCYGASGIIEKSKEVFKVFSKYTVIASGGVGGLFKNSTNFKEINGVALALSIKNNINLKDIEYIQFHPTSLYEEKSKEQKFLLSESLRGEGGKLFNVNGQAFINELLPRDIVSKAILEEEVKTNKGYVYLDIRHMGKEFIIKRFPGIYKGCLEKGIDITKEKIKVTPAQHYFMGGIKVDYNSRTSMKNLFACGEASCTGVHGKNRLASNSLLESLVFSKRGAEFINTNIESLDFQNKKVNTCSLNSLKEILAEDRRNKILALEKLKESRGDLKDELVSYR